MEERRIFPDFNKLKHHNPNVSDEQIAIIKTHGILLKSEYYNDEYYPLLADMFVNIAKKNNLEDHYDELLYMILELNEELALLEDKHTEDYHDDIISKEVGQFLLAIKEVKENHDFQLVAKTITGSVGIKNPAIARWMCDVIYKAIESGNMPFDIFGEKTLLNLFGINFPSEIEITDERLSATANIKPKNPKKLMKENLVRLCLHLRSYLMEHTSLVAPRGVFIPDTHANFFFDVIELLGYVHRDDIASDPKDYMATMIKNYVNHKALIIKEIKTFENR